MKSKKPGYRRNLFVFVAFIVIAAVLGALMLRKYQGSREFPSPPSATAPEEGRTVTLFFASADDDSLVREARSIEPCGELPECVESVLDELTNGPIGDLAPTLPPGASVQDVQIEGDTAVIDFDHEFVDGLPEGSSAEMTAVYSVVDTIAVNFPEIKRVRFLIDGEPLKDLKGHLDLREPLAPDFSLEKHAKPAKK